MRTIIFIHTNNKQGIGALLSKFSIEQKTAHRNDVMIKNINVDDLEIFRNFSGATYLRNGKEITYDTGDLQSFTLSRFMPPELTNYTGRAIVIDPDIFAAEKIVEAQINKVKGPVFHRPDIGTRDLINQRIEMLKQVRG